MANLHSTSGAILFYTPGKDIASLDMDFLVHEGAIVDLSDVCGDYDVYTLKMVEERVEVKEGDILIIHTGYHHYGWDQPTGDEIRYMIKHPGPDLEFAEWAKKKKLRWIGVDCGSADHPMNTKIREWMSRQAKECDAHSQKKYGKTLEEFFSDDKYQLAVKNHENGAKNKYAHIQAPVSIEAIADGPEADVGPKDISFAELHDAFSILELAISEEVGFFERGKSYLAVRKGETKIDGRLPINTSGGLKSKGHPVGATGVSQVVELVRQLRGEAEPGR
ncbi:thiolase C-terminal domain-containing protein [Gracilinema caldarium]|uniref:Thiolase C-terminal domain-containing protein n=1 Tax=Gracilinema caldarium (strain ATCC 51460 / DSM 7334 / H1) TaxID=744872 RepID=F8F1C3_GRAC1|nr:cyclase family protein [Gracilinema caldarium]AEJ18767.1 hypothetical protein Spica_0611 [Gracilinema caldarium DSM 7334]